MPDRRARRYRADDDAREGDRGVRGSASGGIARVAESPAQPRQILIVEAAQERMRLDQFVAAALAPEHSRSQVARMIKAGLVTINGATLRASSVLHRGD